MFTIFNLMIMILPKSFDLIWSIWFLTTFFSRGSRGFDIQGHCSFYIFLSRAIFSVDSISWSIAFARRSLWTFQTVFRQWISACLTCSGTIIFFSICIGLLSLVYHLLQTWLSWSSSTTPLAPDGGRPLWAGRITGRRGARRTASTVASGSCRPKTRYRHGDDSGPLMSSTEDHICSRSAVFIPNSPCTVLESFQHLSGITLKPFSCLKDPFLLGIHGAEDCSVQVY